MICLCITCAIYRDRVHEEAEFEKWEKENKAKQEGGTIEKPVRKSKPGVKRSFKYEEMNHDGKLKDYVIEREAQERLKA